ncbi:MAG: DUF3788 family protein [Euryarchaeota archaeon]|nr:DUF3788 family protein [Euryarchaeota archaeon]
MCASVKEVTPDSKIFLGMLGTKASMWSNIAGYLRENYDHAPVIAQEGKDKSWVIRYRKSGKTLVTLYPRKGELVVLIVLGKDEVAKAKEATLGKGVKETFEGAKQYHDGRWLWLRPEGKADLESIYALLAIKRKPGKKG